MIESSENDKGCPARFIKEKLRDPIQDARQNCGKLTGHKGMHRNMDRDLYWQKGAEISLVEILNGQMDGIKVQI